MKQSGHAEGGMKPGVAIIIAILLALGSGASAEQVPPVPVPKVETVPPTLPANPEPDQRGTEQSPLVVKIAPRPDNGQKESPATWWLTTDQWLALFTGLLVLVGLLQLKVFSAQARQLRRTVDSFLAGERPYIFPSVPITTEFLPGGAHSRYPTAPGAPVPQIGLHFANVGRTPAVIKTARAEIAIGKLPKRPAFKYSQEYRGDIIARPDKQTDIITFGFSRNLTIDEINHIGGGTTPIFVFGYVKYTDNFDYLHTKGFCFHIQLGSKGGAALAGGRAYNYRTAEKTPVEFAT